MRHVSLFKSFYRPEKEMWKLTLIADGCLLKKGTHTYTNNRFMLASLDIFVYYYWNCDIALCNSFCFPFADGTSYGQIILVSKYQFHMMTSSNGDIFRVTGPLCGEFTGPGEFPTQRPVTRSFDVFFDLRLNKRLSKQPRGWWFQTQLWSLWRHCNDNDYTDVTW